MARTKTRRRTRSNKRQKSFKQKIYNMKGCSKLKQKSKRRFRGGNCATCSLSGGSGTNPLIGAPWSSDQTSLSNYYAPNLYDGKDVQTQMQLNGGRRSNKRSNKRRRLSRRKLSRRKLRRRKLRGGGISDFLPADITNLGRDLMYNTSSAYSSLTGAEPPPNPSATQGQLTASVNANRIII